MKKPKPKASKKERGGYADKISVNGSFMDIMKASVNHANKNSAKKKT